MAVDRRQWDSKALSLTAPSRDDLLLNEALLEELKSRKQFESADETQRRIEALECMQKVVEELVRQAMTRKGKYSQATIKAAGGRIVPFGSYALGCHNPGSDIDCVTIAPNAVTRDDFFDLFPKILEETAPAGAVEELTAVPSAFVPIITIVYRGVDLDVSFVGLSTSSVPKDMNFLDDNILRGLDEGTMRAINGPRVAQLILDLVPEPSVFKTALRTIKLWSKVRAVSANIMGFLGGVAWAILVARICQLYPRATSSKIVSRFFWILSKWKWPEPVMLKLPTSGPSGIIAKVWNPSKDPIDARHIMPIITPAFPSMCSTHNVFPSTSAILMREFQRGSQLCDMIESGKLQWKELFAKHNFFTESYRQYLCVNTMSRSKEAQQSWSGTVESKVRTLASNCEKEEAVVVAHPFVKGFERTHKVQNEEQVTEVVEGSLKYQCKDIQTQTTDETNDVRHKAAAELAEKNLTADDIKDETKPEKIDGEMVLYTTTYYVGLEIKQVDNAPLDLSYHVNRLKDICTSHEAYKQGVNDVFVFSVRNTSLPDDVFEEGEKRPVKKRKAPKKANGDANGSQKKRKLADGSFASEVSDR